MTCGRSTKKICRAQPGEEKWTRQITPTSCFETGVRKSEISWSRSKVVDDVYFEISMTYPAKEKDAFDPIVEHVYRSWTLPEVTPIGFWCSPRELADAWSD